MDTAILHVDPGDPAQEGGGYDSLAVVIRHSRMIDRILLFGIPVGGVALILGLYLRG